MDAREGGGVKRCIMLHVLCAVRTQHEQIEAKQMTKQLNNYVHRFDRLLSLERDLTRQHQDVTSSGESLADSGCSSLYIE